MARRVSKLSGNLDDHALMALEAVLDAPCRPPARHQAKKNPPTEPAGDIAGRTCLHNFENDGFRRR
jgi:hypothetical protein